MIYLYTSIYLLNGDGDLDDCRSEGVSAFFIWPSVEHVDLMVDRFRLPSFHRRPLVR